MQLNRRGEEQTSLHDDVVQIAEIAQHVRRNDDVESERMGTQKSVISTWCKWS
jgi:hypothetical protein